ncbi:MAG: hypothetical protein EBQ87_17040, partial [Planctomycetes bacterium]|nr:hypothetical protein [Planctomycetota bacterium]
MPILVMVRNQNKSHPDKKTVYYKKRQKRIKCLNLSRNIMLTILKTVLFLLVLCQRHNLKSRYEEIFKYELHRTSPSTGGQSQL